MLLNFWKILYPDFFFLKFIVGDVKFMLFKMRTFNVVNFGY